MEVAKPLHTRVSLHMYTGSGFRAPGLSDEAEAGFAHPPSASALL